MRDEKPSDPYETACESLRTTSILVTGATGFIGFNLARRLIQEGLQITAMVSPSANRKRLRFLEDHGRVVCHDLRRSMNELLSKNGFSMVFHLAALGTDSREHSPHDLLGVNVASSMELAGHVAKTKGRLVWTGSVFELGSSRHPMKETDSIAPESLYAWSKTAFLDYLQKVASPSSWVALRLFGVYGPFEAGHRLIPYLVEQLSNGRKAELTHGRQIRDWVFVDDVIDALLLAASQTGAEGRLVHVGTGQGTSTREVALLVAKGLGREDLVRFGAKKAPASEPDRMVADISKARHTLGWTPGTDLEEGLRRTVAWHLSGGESRG